MTPTHCPVPVNACLGNPEAPKHSHWHHPARCLSGAGKGVFVVRNGTSWRSLISKLDNRLRHMNVVMTWSCHCFSQLQFGGVPLTDNQVFKWAGTDRHRVPAFLSFIQNV